jgi:hypothetical protein
MYSWPLSWRLDVEVAVAEHRRSVVAGRRPHFPDGERLTVPVDDVGLPARVADEVPDPLRRSRDITRMRGVGADRRDPEEVGELVEPVGAHAAASLTDGDAPPAR